MTFAFGTLIFTVTAITVAPQVVMFLGLTHATIGLDRVRPGGPEDPDIRLPGRPRFRWLTRSMLLGFMLGAAGLALTVSTIVGAPFSPRRGRGAARRRCPGGVRARGRR